MAETYRGWDLYSNGASRFGVHMRGNSKELLRTMIDFHIADDEFRRKAWIDTIARLAKRKKQHDKRQAGSNTNHH
jgi:hypothetical protein